MSLVLAAILIIGAVVVYVKANMLGSTALMGLSIVLSVLGIVALILRDNL